MMTPPSAGLSTGTDDLLLDVADGVATLTLNRPERKNALSPAIIAALGPTIRALDVAEDVRCVVITGTGSVFCAGGDVKSFDEQGGEGGGSDTPDPEAVRIQQQEQRAIVGGLRALGKPVLASLPGAAAGAGLGLALAADLRIGTPRAVMVSAFVGVGLSGDFGTSWQLQQLLGRGRTAEIMLLGERVDAEACLRLGLLNWVVERDELAARTTQIARRLADGPPLAIRNAKQNLVTAESKGLLEAMDDEVVLHKECGVSADHREAVSAFLERRPAVFSR